MKNTLEKISKKKEKTPADLMVIDAVNNKGENFDTIIEKCPTEDTQRMFSKAYAICVDMGENDAANTIEEACSTRNLKRGMQSAALVFCAQNKNDEGFNLIIAACTTNKEKSLIISNAIAICALAKRKRILKALIGKCHNDLIKYALVEAITTCANENKQAAVKMIVANCNKDFKEFVMAHALATYLINGNKEALKIIISECPKKIKENALAKALDIYLDNLLTPAKNQSLSNLSENKFIEALTIFAMNDGEAQFRTLINKCPDNHKENVLVKVMENCALTNKNVEALNIVVCPDDVRDNVLIRAIVSFAKKENENAIKALVANYTDDIKENVLTLAAATFYENEIEKVYKTVLKACPKHLKKNVFERLEQISDEIKKNELQKMQQEEGKEEIEEKEVEQVEKKVSKKPNENELLMKTPINSDKQKPNATSEAVANKNTNVQTKNRKKVKKATVSM